MHEDTPGKQDRDVLPLFPLHTVLLPSAHLPLHVFEPRYRQLTLDLMSGAIKDTEFGVIAIRNSLVNDVEQADQIHDIGCAAVLREAKRLEGGMFDIVSTGTRRFRLLELIAGQAPYLMGRIEWVPDEPPGSEPKLAGLVAAATAAHERYCELAWSDDDWSQPAADEPIETLAYRLAADCLLPLSDRQALLAQPQPLTRLRMITQWLTREAGFLCALGAIPAQQHGFEELGAQANLN